MPRTTSSPPTKRVRPAVLTALFLILIVAVLLRLASNGADSPESDRDPANPGAGPDSLSGRWRPGKDTRNPVDLTPEQRESLALLQSIGYLSGYEQAPEQTGVTRHHPSRSWPGYNLYTSGHAPEAVLMDMEGNPRHRWSYPFVDAFPEYVVPRDSNAPDYWRRVHLYENGDLLAIYEGLGMIRVDRDSRLLWAFPQGAHHDVFVDEEGIIYVLTREAKMIPRVHPSRPVLEDFITVVDATGFVRGRVSLLEALERSPYARFLEDRPDSADILHTNTIEILDGAPSGPAVFSRGNALVSMLQLDLIGVVDMQRKAVTWALRGGWSAQHEPSLLPNGNILLFDNRGRDGLSRILEIDPVTEETVWEYTGEKDGGFYTYDCGSVHRLPNGNTLIVESNSGRAFEIDGESEIVWEFLNPARAGEKGDLVATLLDMVRVPVSYCPWLETAN